MRSVVIVIHIRCIDELSRQNDAYDVRFPIMIISVNGEPTITSFLSQVIQTDLLTIFQNQRIGSLYWE